MSEPRNPRHPRVGYHGGSLNQPDSATLFLAHERDHAAAFATSDPDATVTVWEDHSRNPLILDTAEAFLAAWTASGAREATGAFNPDIIGHLILWAHALGHDAIVIPESAFEGDLGYEWVAGTVGEPQTIILDLTVARRVPPGRTP